MRLHTGGIQTHVRESAVKVDSGRKIPCHTRESNLCQWHYGPMLYQLSYIPMLPVSVLTILDCTSLEETYHTSLWNLQM